MVEDDDDEDEDEDEDDKDEDDVEGKCTLFSRPFAVDFLTVYRFVLYRLLSTRIYYWKEYICQNMQTTSIFLMSFSSS